MCWLSRWHAAYFLSNFETYQRREKWSKTHDDGKYNNQGMQEKPHAKPQYSERLQAGERKTSAHGTDVSQPHADVQQAKTKESESVHCKGYDVSLCRRREGSPSSRSRILSILRASRSLFGVEQDRWLIKCLSQRMLVANPHESVRE